MESYTQFWVGRPDPVHPDPGNPVFPEIFFLLFFASMDLLGPQGHPPDGPESPNPDPDREIRFFENPDFLFFFSLFFASTDLLVPQGRPRMDRNHLIRIRILEIRFFEKSGLFVFSSF